MLNLRHHRVSLLSGVCEGLWLSPNPCVPSGSGERAPAVPQVGRAADAGTDLFVLCCPRFPLGREPLTPYYPNSCIMPHFRSHSVTCCILMSFFKKFKIIFSVFYCMHYFKLSVF